MVIVWCESLLLLPLILLFIGTVVLAQSYFFLISNVLFHQFLRLLVVLINPNGECVLHSLECQCEGLLMIRLDHAAEKTRTNELQKVLWMMAGHDADNMVMIFLYAADEFAMWEFLPKAQKEKEEWEVKFEATLARFEKWKESSKNLKKLIDSSMSTRTKIGLGFQAYFGVDEVFDLSTYLECILLRPTQRHHASCDSSLKTQTKDIPPADDIMTLPKSDIEDPNSTTGSPNCDFYNCVDSVPCNSKAASVSAGSRKSPASDQQSILLGRRISPASVPAGRSDSAASRKQPAVHSVVLHIYMVGLMPANFDSGAQEVEQEKRKACCFVPNQGWHCNFCSGDGRISGKGTIRTFKADFENVYYVESCSTLTYFLCGTKKSRKHDLYTFHISDLQPEQKHMGLLVLPISGIDQKYYSLVVTDDFSRFSWTFFLGTKDETFYVLKEFIALIENQLNKKGIKRDIAILEPHNKMGLLREKNRTLIEAARTMLADSKLPTMFWTEAVSTACYVLNRVSITNPHNKTPYELISGKIMQLFILETGLVLWERNADYAEELARLQIKNMKLGRCLPIWIMLGCSAVKDSAGIDSVVRAPDGIVFADGVSTGSPSADSDPADGHPADSFTPAGSVDPADKSNPAVSSSVSADLNSVYADASTLPPGQQLGTSENTTRFPVPSDVCMDQLSSGIFTSSSYDDDFSATLTNLAPAVEVHPIPTKRVNTIHPQSQILGDLASPVLTRSRAQKSKFGESAFIGYIQDQQRTNHTDQLHCLSACFLSQLEPTSIAKALEDPDWVDAMQEEMQQFINQQVWKLVPLPAGKHAIGTKWILKNKRDARGIVVRNKARLVAQGHRQEEGIDYDEVFAPVARIEAIRLFLAFASYMGFLVYQLDVKSAFLYGEIEEEVYVTQPKGFEDPYFPKHVYRVVKALYGLHQAPRAWYARLSTFLLQHNYRRGTIDNESSSKKDSQGYNFGQVSQVKQLPDRFSISQDKFVQLQDHDIKFAVSACSRHQVTPLTSHLMQLEAYSDSDYAGSHGDRKSTTGGCQFLGRRLNLFGSARSSPYVATSSTEAEYVAAASCCAQVLWIQNQLLDYGFNFMNTKIFIDNQSTICIVKNPVFHQRTKHIEIRHHFIRDANEKNLIQVLKIHTDDNVADLLTKAFDGPRFAYLVVHIGMVNPSFVVNTAAGSYPSCCKFVILPAGRMVSAGWSMVLLVVILPAGRMVSAGWSMVLLVVILPAGRMVSAGWSMVLLVVMFPAARLVSAGWSMLVVLFPAARLDSAGCTMALLEVIVPAGFFVPAGSYGLCCW
ncbi:putative ribonuclease H-like domain-containing protein [Tanacetum coccineum]